MLTTQRVGPKPVSYIAPSIHQINSSSWEILVISRLKVDLLRTVGHRWELPGNYPDLTMVIVIYHNIERIWRILVTPVFLYNIYDH